MPVAAVTGGNKGIGLSIVRQLALRYPSSALYNGAQSPFLIYLTARNRERGLQAVQALNEDETLREAKALKAHGGLTEIAFEPLDVSDGTSISDFVAKIKELHGAEGGLDILVNNAGVAIDGFDYQKAHDTVQTNYFGTLALMQALLPNLIKPGGRVVNVSSMVGKLNKYSSELNSSFRNAANPDVTAATAADSAFDPAAPTSDLMKAFVESVKNGSYSQDGWPTSAYAVSKSGVTGATMAVAAYEKAKRPDDGRLINACCPGYVNTDMTKGRGRKTTDQGAETPAHLALADLGGVTGQLWERCEVSNW